MPNRHRGFKKINPLTQPAWQRVHRTGNGQLSAERNHDNDSHDYDCHYYYLHKTFPNENMQIKMESAVKRETFGPPISAGFWLSLLLWELNFRFISVLRLDMV